MKITAISLFPDVFEPMMSTSMMRKAREGGQLEFTAVNLRDFGLGERQTVDDAPYGGGDGMLLKPEPVVAAIEYVQSRSRKSKVESRKSESANSSDEQGSGVEKVLLMSPQGQRLTQSTAQQLADEVDHLILVCGRYEGFDERIREFADGQISIGDYVLTGGELPAMVVADAVVRLIPGVLGGDESAAVESFSDGVTLEYPQYTRPEEFRGVKVPEVLLSGDHGRIAAWRAQQAAERNS